VSRRKGEGRETRQELNSKPRTVHLVPRGSPVADRACIAAGTPKIFTPLTPALSPLVCVYRSAPVPGRRNAESGEGIQVVQRARLSPSCCGRGRPHSAGRIPPSGRGRRGSGIKIVPTRWDIFPAWMTAPLSLGERARVRGNNAGGFRARGTIPGTVELRESSGRAGGFPR